MEYRSVADLNDRIVDWSYALPRDLDVVVGVPRSGLLAANLLALHLDCPLTDVDGLIAGRVLATGNRFRGPPVDSILKRPAKVLVVDDSVRSGGTLEGVRSRLKEARLPHEILYGAVFPTPEAVQASRVVHFAEAVPSPRIFAWNIMQGAVMRSCCVDIDGVLCVDPTASENDDGPRYREFLRTATPLLIPKYEIGWLVTSRLEKYRAETESWLERHNVRFRELVMMQAPDQAARQAAGAYGRFKAEAYVDSGAKLFIESAESTAAEIMDRTGRPVFCFDTREMLYPDGYPRQRHVPVRPLGPFERAVHWAAHLPGRVVRRASRTLRNGTGRASHSQVSHGGR